MKYNHCDLDRMPVFYEYRVEEAFRRYATRAYWEVDLHYPDAEIVRWARQLTLKAGRPYRVQVRYNTDDVWKTIVTIYG